MKKNIILVLVLTLLISLAYQLEEISKPKQAKEIENSQRILVDSLSVSNISFPAVKVELESKTGQWIIPKMNYPASTKAVNSIITILKGLRFSSTVNSESEEQYFKSNEIAFSISGMAKKVELVLGDLSKVSGNFYLKVNNKLFIANDHSHFSDTYTDELDLKYKRYLRLVKMLKLVGNDLIDKRLFGRVNLSQTKFVKINNKRNRWFQLDFDNENTNPEPFQSIRKKNLKKYFNFYLKQVFIKEIVQTEKNVFTNLVSEVNFGGSKSSTNIKLFAGLNGQYGKFVRISGDDRVYEIEDEGSEIFYSNVQDYWWKKFPINVDFKSIDSFEYEISLDHKNFEKFSKSKNGLRSVSNPLVRPKNR